MNYDGDKQRGFGWIIFLFTVSTTILIGTAWYASGIAPDLMSRNYRSVQYAAQMESALVSIFLDEVNGQVPSPDDVARFDENLRLAKANITETNEGEAIEAVSAKWMAFRGKPISPSVEAFKSVASAIRGIVDLNEKAMLAFEKRAVEIRYAVLFGSLLPFFLVLVYAWEVTQVFRPKKPKA